MLEAILWLGQKVREALFELFARVIASGATPCGTTVPVLFAGPRAVDVVATPTAGCSVSLTFTFASGATTTIPTGVATFCDVTKLVIGCAPGGATGSCTYTVRSAAWPCPL